MIKINLRVLLAERNLNITKVSNDTKISRTTLTALARNNCKGMHFDTLNTLCTYLHVKPSDIIQYIPKTAKSLTVEIRNRNMTNYERIKNMSIEEMAVSLMCPADIDETFEKSESCKDRNWCKCTLEWLESEINDN